MLQTRFRVAASGEIAALLPVASIQGRRIDVSRENSEQSGADSSKLRKTHRERNVQDSGTYPGHPLENMTNFGQSELAAIWVFEPVDHSVLESGF